ncbi:MAG TPA: FHA domain-containing protein [Kofleriaceae bacterium]|nr:FHA domain-containing protein [Kofleriaceae bacterium]
MTVSEAGQPPLPAVDLEEPRVAIGSGAGARIRLPAAVAREEHLEITPEGWRALAEVIVDGAVQASGASGPLARGVVFELGAYRVRVEPAPPGTAASPPQRTESLARELVRGLLGAGAAPTLEIARGPSSGAVRALPPPEAVLVIGRGDEAGWVILDEDLSRAHAEVRRGWDGVSIRDLGSKNGTRVDGARAGAGGVLLGDGARIELGKVALVFRDPAERHLRGASEPPAVAPAGAALAALGGASAPGQSGPGPWIRVVALAIAAAALAGLIWILAG